MIGIFVLNSLSLSIKKIIPYLIVLSGFITSIKAQQRVVPSLSFSSNHFLVFNYFNFASKGNTINMFYKPDQKQLPAVSSGSINDMPFFCAMECRVRHHTNIWIKLRAGNDSSYEKMIHSADK